MGLNVYGHALHGGFKYALKVFWCLCCAAVFWRTYIYYKYSLEYTYLHQLLGGSLCLGRASASVLNLNCAVILLPMCHTLAVLVNRLLRKMKIQCIWLRWNSRSIHIFIGYIIFFFTGIHITSHALNLRNFIISSDNNDIGVHPFPNDTKILLKMLLFTVSGVTGLSMVTILLVMVVTSIHRIRGRFYNLFWYSHRLFFFFYVLLIVHGFRGPLRKQINVDRHHPGCNGTNVAGSNNTQNLSTGGESILVCQEDAKFAYIGCESWVWIAGPIVLYLLDFSFRLLRRSHVLEPSDVTWITNDVMECSFQVPYFKAKPGQYVLLNCGAVSALEWHPLTIAQVPHEENNHQLKVIMKKSGDWTEKVGALFNETGSEYSGEELVMNRYPEFRVDGPYCSPMEAMVDYDVIVCIAGGVGITPFLAYINHLKVKKIQTVSKNRKWFYLLFSARDERLLQHCLLETNATKSQLQYECSPTEMNLELYLTRNKPFNNQIFSGRPNLDKYFQTIKKKHRRSSIGTFVCGPAPLCSSVKTQCLKHSCPETKFIFHKESF